MTSVAEFNSRLADLDEAARKQAYLSYARAALAHYDLPDAEPAFLQHNAGITYRIDSPRMGVHLLKIHVPAGQGTWLPNPDRVEARLTWLLAVDRLTELVVQAPIPNRRGELLTRLSGGGLPDQFPCSIQRWIDGEPARGGLTEHQISRVGAMMGAMHAAGSRHPELRQVGVLPRYDPTDTGIPERICDLEAMVSLGILTPSEYAVVAEAGALLEQRLAQFGETRDSWGPIHGDLHPGNLLFSNGEPRAVDFDGLQLGPYAFDLGTTIYHIFHQGPAARRTLLDGYRSAMPSSQIKSSNLDLALLYGVVGNLAFQATLPDQWPTAQFRRNMKQLVDEFCRPLLSGEPIVLA